eukprot:CAMPEP_0173116028 /NCGR_PEP_ID=MMETSP1102-20130122/48982_1 /TAXON_ID=49646 /ORGANISM="Geminigera sp., Strain Caron Lab Isolate" /LENGTH=202 /DNA_ID=CAMNT_0014019437 /DNA_START=9 /DNA_END=617 /DNA_ORIENTATION=-
MSGDALMALCKGNMETFFGLAKGGIEPVGILFSELAGEPMPPAVIMQVLNISEDQLKEAQKSQIAPTCSLDQFFEAMKASVDEGDDIANYKTVLEKHINRMEVAEKVITELRPKMTAFHQKVEGSLAKIEGLFTDMAPEPQKGKPMPPGMINALLRVPKEATICTCEDFIECFQRESLSHNRQQLCSIMSDVGIVECIIVKK